MLRIKTKRAGFLSHSAEYTLYETPLSPRLLDTCDGVYPDGLRLSG